MPHSLYKHEQDFRDRRSKELAGLPGALQIKKDWNESPASITNYFVSGEELEVAVVR